MMPHQNKPKILVIDDEPIIQSLMTDLLEANGYQVIVAADGLEGIAAVKQTDFDIIFCDIHMPHINGLEAMRKIKEIKPQSVFVIMCSYADNVSKQASHEGAVLVLEKPFDIHDALNVAEKILASSKPRAAIT